MSEQWRISGHWTRKQVYQVIDKAMAEIAAMRNHSGEAYAEDTRPFANFEEEAYEMDTTPEYVMLFHANKHWRFIRQWVKAHPTIREKMEGREAIHGRIYDLIQYLLLMDAKIREDRE